MSVPKSDLVKELIEQEEVGSIKQANELVERIGSVERTALENKVGKAMFYGNLVGLMASTAAYLYGTLSGNFLESHYIEPRQPHVPEFPYGVEAGLNKAGQLDAISTMFFLATTSVSAAWKKLMKPHIVKVNEEIYGEDPNPESVVETYKELKSLKN